LGSTLTWFEIVSESPVDVTSLVLDLERSGGSGAATERLFEEVYGQLRHIASGIMSGERRNHTLQPTALVHEAYLKLVNAERVQWQGRAHFLRLAARAMRRILVSHARSRATEKRGGGWTRVTLDEEVGGETDHAFEVLALNKALDTLTEMDARAAQVVELRFFAGMPAREVAHVLGVSKRTVDSDWKFAKLWLLHELFDESGP
jgi:RNA polymerase sigma factor (TIGR02999 family)